jgi:hypothetical protein
MEYNINGRRNGNLKYYINHMLAESEVISLFHSSLTTTTKKKTEIKNSSNLGLRIL